MVDAAVEIVMSKLSDYTLFLDDERMPPSEMENVTIVRDFWEFKRVIVALGIPSYVSFDHDLGSMDFNGKDCAEFLIMRMIMERPSNMEDFQYYVHSQNPVGAENIRRFMDKYLEDIENGAYA